MKFEVELTYESEWVEKEYGKEYVKCIQPAPVVEINTIEELRDFVLQANKDYNLFEPNTVVITFSGNDIPVANTIEIYNGYRE